MNDTIFALATPPGRGAVAVIRLSGPMSLRALSDLGLDRISPRRATLRRLRTVDGEVLDQALALWFPGPASYTGEDAAELHLHGGRAVVEAAISALVALGLRPADPGEFTRRAFQNGKLDLTQAEAVADLVDAETAAQRRQAMDQLGGALGRKYEAWRLALVDMLALLEAEIDFPDENLPGGLAARTGPELRRLRDDLDAALAGLDRGDRIRDGFRVALIGAPNAGKSSLFNRIVGREAAIVTATPGTTRDVIEAALDLGGYKVLLADTAGIRDTGHDIEAEGVKRALAWAEGADLRLWVIDSSGSKGDWREAADLLQAGDVVVANKADLPRGDDLGFALAKAEAVGALVQAVSAAAGVGLDALSAVLRMTVSDALSGADFPAATQARHRLRLTQARDHLSRGLEALNMGPELAAEDLRLATRALAAVAGRVDAEDVLDVVFARFCIGK